MFSLSVISSNVFKTISLPTKIFRTVGVMIVEDVNPFKVSSIFSSATGRKLETGFSETMLFILEKLSQDILDDSFELLVPRVFH